MPGLPSHHAPPGLPTPGDLSAAVDALKRVRRARAVARFNGWSAIILGVPAAIFGIFSLTSLIVGAALIALGFRELRLGDRLTKLDPAACRGLAVNQIVLLAGVLVYCAWMAHAGLTGPTLGDRAPELESLAAGTTESIDALVRTATLAIYATVAALSLVFQGFTARYYATRRQHIQTLLDAGDAFRLTAREAAAA